MSSGMISKGPELAQLKCNCELIQRSPVRFWARCNVGLIEYNEVCCMHITPAVVHNFLRAVGE